MFTRRGGGGASGGSRRIGERQQIKAFDLAENPSEFSWQTTERDFTSFEDRDLGNIEADQVSEFLPGNADVTSGRGRHRSSHGMRRASPLQPTG